MVGLRRLGVFFCVLCLAACAHHQRGVVSVAAQPCPMPACQTKCKERLDACSAVCRDDCNHCHVSADDSMKKRYQRYLQRLIVTHGYLTRQLKSYRDPLQCRKSTCNCQIDYTICMQACDGFIHKRLQVVPGCC